MQGEQLAQIVAKLRELSDSELRVLTVNEWNARSWFSWTRTMPGTNEGGELRVLAQAEIERRREARQERHDFLMVLVSGLAAVAAIASAVAAFIVHG